MAETTTEKKAKTPQELFDSLIAGLGDAFTLTVETRYIVVEEGKEQPAKLPPGVLVGKTNISLDGDTILAIPMVKSAAGTLVVDDRLLSLHTENVANAAIYRKEMILAAVEAVKGLLTIVKK